LVGGQRPERSAIGFPRHGGDRARRPRAAVRRAGRARQRDGVARDGGIDVDTLDLRTQRSEVLERDDAPHVDGALERALDDGQLVLGAGVADDHLQHEAVDLRLGERVRALGLDRVLRRHHEERVGNRHRLPADGHLPLLHHLEQCRLDLGRGPVDLVGEQEVDEHRA